MGNKASRQQAINHIEQVEKKKNVPKDVVTNLERAKSLLAVDDDEFDESKLEDWYSTMSISLTNSELCSQSSHSDSHSVLSDSETCFYSTSRNTLIARSVSMSRSSSVSESLSEVEADFSEVFALNEEDLVHLYKINPEFRGLVKKWIEGLKDQQDLGVRFFREVLKYVAAQQNLANSKKNKVGAAQYALNVIRTRIYDTFLATDKAEDKVPEDMGGLNQKDIRSRYFNPHSQEFDETARKLLNQRIIVIRDNYLKKRVEEFKAWDPYKNWNTGENFATKHLRGIRFRRNNNEEVQDLEKAQALLIKAKKEGAAAVKLGGDQAEYEKYLRQTEIYRDAIDGGGAFVAVPGYLNSLTSDGYPASARRSYKDNGYDMYDSVYEKDHSVEQSRVGGGYGVGDGFYVAPGQAFGVYDNGSGAGSAELLLLVGILALLVCMICACLHAIGGIVAGVGGFVLGRHHSRRAAKGKETVNLSDLV